MNDWIRYSIDFVKHLKFRLSALKVSGEFRGGIPVPSRGSRGGGGENPPKFRTLVLTLVSVLRQNHRSFTNYIVTMDIKEIPLDFQASLIFRNLC